MEGRRGVGPVRCVWWMGDTTQAQLRFSFVVAGGREKEGQFERFMGLNGRRVGGMNVSLVMNTRVRDCHLTKVAKYKRKQMWYGESALKICRALAICHTATPFFSCRRPRRHRRGPCSTLTRYSPNTISATGFQHGTRNGTHARSCWGAPGPVYPCRVLGLSDNDIPMAAGPRHLIEKVCPGIPALNRWACQDMTPST